MPEYRTKHLVRCMFTEIQSSPGPHKLGNCSASVHLQRPEYGLRHPAKGDYKRPMSLMKKNAPSPSVRSPHHTLQQSDPRQRNVEDNAASPLRHRQLQLCLANGHKSNQATTGHACRGTTTAPYRKPPHSSHAPIT